MQSCWLLCEWIVRAAGEGADRKAAVLIRWLGLGVAVQEISGGIRNIFGAW